MTDFVRRHTMEPLDGKYRIVSRLGAGGMGEVYRAEHTHLHTTRVIKLMRPNLSPETGATERFLREARLATKIHHPNVATLHDFSMLPDGSYYMVWEFIEGKNLTEVLRRDGAFSPKRAATLAIQALHGLDAIHRAGIIHRDISPDNIMLTRDDYGQEHAKIIDLGIAKSGGDNVEHTQTGIFIGKLKYCSPEHLGMLPEGEKMDGRADLYSFGIVLYEMVTGAAPFTEETPQQYLLSHARRSPRPLATVKPELAEAPELEAVIFKALAKERTERYSSAREFADALQQIVPRLSDTPVAAASDRTIVVPTTGATPTVITDTKPTYSGSAAPQTLAGTQPSPGRVPTPTRSAASDPTLIATPLPPVRDTIVNTPRAGDATIVATPVPAKRSGGGLWLVILLLLIAVLGLAAFAILRRGDEPPKKDDVVTNTTTTATTMTTTETAATTIATTTLPPGTSLTVTTPTATDTTATATSTAMATATTATSTTTPVTTTQPSQPTVATSTQPSKARPKVEPKPTATTTPAVATAEPEPAVAAADTAPLPTTTAADRGGRLRGLMRGRGGKALVDSPEFKSGFAKGIIPDYGAMTAASNVQWAYVAPGVRLSDYSYRIGKFRNLTAVQNDTMMDYLEGEEMKSAITDVTTGSRGSLTAEGAVVWAEASRGAKRGVAIEMIFRDGSGKIVGMLRHRIFENSPEDAAEEMPEAVAEFIEENR